MAGDGQQPGRERFAAAAVAPDPFDGFEEHLGGVPVGGFFCNGEIGPVGGTTFLHGYTSSFGLFRPRLADAIPDPELPREGELDDPEPRPPGQDPRLEPEATREPEPLV